MGKHQSPAVDDVPQGSGVGPLLFVTYCSPIAFLDFLLILPFRHHSKSR